MKMYGEVARIVIVLNSSWLPPCYANAVEENGSESRQSSLLYVFVFFFRLDRAKNTIVVYY